jgi:hypothetical protein
MLTLLKRGKLFSFDNFDPSRIFARTGQECQEKNRIMRSFNRAKEKNSTLF